MLAYFLAGTAVGLYLVRLLVLEYGALIGREDAARLVPAALLASIWFTVPLYAAARSWCLLFPAGGAPGAWQSVRLTWIGLSVNWLLPAALVGGELVKLRLALRRVPDGAVLVASLVGDKTIQVATQVAYTLLGLVILAWTSGALGGGVREAAGFLLFSGMVYLFYRLQRGGLFARAAAPLKGLVRDGGRIEVNAARIDAAVDGMYRRGRRLWWAVGWRLGFRLLMAMEVALVFWWLGEPAGLWVVLAIESMAQASRIAAMVVPAALGAQEMVIMAVGLLLGAAPEALIAVAVAKRIRELGIGGAGLVAWQLQETRTLIRNDG